MDRCYKKMCELEELFKAELENIDALKINQKIYRYLGGNVILFEMLQKGIFIFDSYIDVFRKNNSPEITQKYRVDIADKIVALFRKCHSVLALSCHKNPKYQLYLFENFLNLLMLVNKLDLGQIELISEILKENIELITKITDSHLKYFCNLIVQYGRKELFLKVFHTLANEPGQETLDVQKKTLFILLDEHYIDAINPFVPIKKKVDETNYRNGFQSDDNPLFYTSKLLEVIILLR
jgi:hypothetical protein